MVTKVYMFHKGSNVAKKIDAWVQKELSDSQQQKEKEAHTETAPKNPEIATKLKPHQKVFELSTKKEEKRKKEKKREERKKTP